MNVLRWRTWTLTRQLVVGVCALVTLVLVAMGVASSMTMRHSLTGVIDNQLLASADGFSYSVTKYRISPDNHGHEPPPGAMKPLTQVVGQAPKNVIALIQNGKVVDSAIFHDGAAGPAPQDVVADMPKLATEGSGKRVVWLPDLGEYLMETRPGDGREILVTAVFDEARHGCGRQGDDDRRRDDGARRARHRADHGCHRAVRAASPRQGRLDRG
ncbi:MAG: two-component system, OmpR family, sensor histidine kinase TrcS, partial [Mycobacterium sp.]|nr:two-component system, OmpR family, sensor histidine kinase TrcS [Mycobacterium sp.]